MFSFDEPGSNMDSRTQVGCTLQPKTGWNTFRAILALFHPASRKCPAQAKLTQSVLLSQIEFTSKELVLIKVILGIDDKRLHRTGPSIRDGTGQS